MPANNNDLEKRLWDAADELRANSRLRAAEYSAPVLGLIFLRYADHRFAVADAAIQTERAAAAEAGCRQRPVSSLDYQARGVLYLPEEARFSHLVALAIQDLMWQLPKCYTDTLCKQKSAAVYQHVYDSYYGAGQSVYAVAGS